MKRLLMILSVFIVINANAQDSLNITKLGEIAFWNDAYDVRVVGDIAFLADNRSGLHVVDISDQANPQNIGLLFPGTWMKIVEVAGDFVYCAEYREMHCLNASNPSQIIQEGSYTYPSGSGSIKDISVSENYAYVSVHSYGLSILNITDPANIYQESHLSGYEGCIGIYGNYLYVESQTGLSIINVSDPSNPIDVGSFAAPASIYKFVISGDYLYATNFNTSDYGLFIIRIDNPVNPTILSTLSGNFTSIVKAGLHVFASLYDPDHGISIIDVSYPYDPFEVAICPESEYGYGLAVANDILFVADYRNGLLMFDVSNLANPSYTGEYSFPNIGEPWTIVLNGNYAYTRCVNATAYVNLGIVNITNPAVPFLEGYIDSASIALICGNYALGGSQAFSTDWDIYDVSNPAAPIPVAPVNIDIGNVTDFDSYNNYVYFTTEYDGLVIVDMSDPLNPAEVSRYDITYPYAVKVVENIAYIGDWFGNVTILDVSNPNNPVEVSIYDTQVSFVIESIAANENYACVAMADQGIEVVDVSDPFSPTFLNFIYIIPAYNVYKLFLQGNNLYVAQGPDGYMIYNLDNLPNYWVSGYYVPSLNAYYLVPDSELAYGCAGCFFQVLDCSDVLPVESVGDKLIPDRFALIPPYPNPFNPTTAIGFELPVPSKVKLNVYDVNSRIVAEVVDGYRSAGSHEVTFDGSGLASGVYLYRLEAGDFSATGKMVLLK